MFCDIWLAKKEMKGKEKKKGRKRGESPLYVFVLHPRSKMRFLVGSYFVNDG